MTFPGPPDVEPIEPVDEWSDAELHPGRGCVYAFIVGTLLLVVCIVMLMLAL